ncbi:MAG: hypothetical protein ACRYFX_30455 [Janthinobacterium lividum]
MHENYSLELVKLNKVAANLHFIPQIGYPSVVTTRGRYVSALRNVDANVISDMEAMGNKFSDEENRSIRANLKKRNNLLEIKQLANSCAYATSSWQSH